jgi:hypothetical protein
MEELLVAPQKKLDMLVEIACWFQPKPFAVTVSLPLFILLV